MVHRLELSKVGRNQVSRVTVDVRGEKKWS